MRCGAWGRRGEEALQGRLSMIGEGRMDQFKRSCDVAMCMQRGVRV